MRRHSEIASWRNVRFFKKNNFSHRILLFLLTLSFDVTSERHLIYCIIYAGFYTLLPILSYISCIFLLLSRCVMTPGWILYIFMYSEAENFHSPPKTGGGRKKFWNLWFTYLASISNNGCNKKVNICWILFCGNSRM